LWGNLNSGEASRLNEDFTVCLKKRLPRPNLYVLKKYLSSYWIRSAFYTILQRFSITLFGLVNFMILIRTLTKPQMGVWALFLVVTSIFETTKGGLLKNAHIRYVSSSGDPEEKTVIASASLLINSSITALFILLIVFFSGWASIWLHTGAGLSEMLKWFIPGLIGMVIFSHLEAIQQSHLDFKGVFAGYFVRQVAFFLLILFHTVLRIPFTLNRLAIYQSACIFLGVIVIYFYSRKYLHHRFDPTRAWIRKILGYGGYIFSSGMVANVFSNLDQVMTARFIDSGAVAIYNAASRINQVIDIPSYAAAEVIFPKLSQASAQEEGIHRVRYLYERMVAVLLSFTVPTAVFIILFPKLVIAVIAGSRYAMAAPILQLYMITGILRPMQNQAANLLNSIGKQALCFIINSVSLVANLIINYTCFHYIGFYGAAIGTLITCALGSFAWYMIMRRQIGTRLSHIFIYMTEFYKILYTNARKLLAMTKKANS
jgi:lipopolysaccharide exporter